MASSRRPSSLWMTPRLQCASAYDGCACEEKSKSQSKVTFSGACVLLAIFRLPSTKSWLVNLVEGCVPTFVRHTAIFMSITELLMYLLKARASEDLGVSSGVAVPPERAHSTAWQPRSPDARCR